MTTVEGKGLGLVAREALSQGSVVAYYLTKRYKHPRHSEYAVKCRGKGGVDDLFRGSFPPPGDDGVPYLAPFANEPSRSQHVNCELVGGEHGRYALRTLVAVNGGAELVWDYGPAYGKRAYHVPTVDKSK